MLEQRIQLSGLLKGWIWIAPSVAPSDENQLEMPLFFFVSKERFRLQHQLHMLNVYVCLNSQHSRWRLRALFNSTHGLEENISIFYGNYFNSNKDVTLTHFNYIDLDDFFAHTAPELVVLRVSQFYLWLQVLLPVLLPVMIFCYLVSIQHGEVSTSKTQADTIWLLLLLQPQV